MKHVYFISGLGADERVFAQIDFGNNPTHYIPWKKPSKEESIEEYAGRMAQEIQHDNPVLVGLSFGGMLSIEIAKFRAVSKVILISSIKTRYEKPWYMKAAASLRLNHLLPLRPFPFLDSIENKRLGARTERQKELYREYRRNLDLEYSDWAIDKILNWENEWTPSALIHIHARDDKIFPIEPIHADYVIDDGGHMLIMNHPQRVSTILQAEI